MGTQIKFNNFTTFQHVFRQNNDILCVLIGYNIIKINVALRT